jgi:hypothetical protein
VPKLVVARRVVGPSVAHEPIEQGFEVEGYVALAGPGGKARSDPIGARGNPGPIGMRKDLRASTGCASYRACYAPSATLLHPSRAPAHAAHRRSHACECRTVGSPVPLLRQVSRGGIIPPSSTDSGMATQFPPFPRSASVREAQDG